MLVVTYRHNFPSSKRHFFPSLVAAQDDHPNRRIDQHIAPGQGQDQGISLPQTAGVTLGGLIRLHGNVGVIRRNEQHPTLHRAAVIHLLRQFPDRAAFHLPAVARPICCLIIDHINRPGGVVALRPACGQKDCLQ